MSRQPFKAEKKSKLTKDDTTTNLTLPLPENLNKHISWDTDDMSPECDTIQKSPNQRKRQLETETETVFEIPDLGGDFNDIFANLKADVTKSMSAKRKKFESYAKTSNETTKRKIDDTYSKQETDRGKLTQDFVVKVKKLSDELQEEMKKMSETQEHLLSVFKHYHKISQQTLQKSSNTFKTILSTSQEYKQKCVELNKKHQKEKEELQTELESEIQNLQKKIISYSKQEGIANFKKSLESMLTMDENES